MRPSHLTGERVYLRALRKEDAAAAAAWHPGPLPINAPAAEEFLKERHKTAWWPSDPLHLAVVRSEDDAVVGGVELEHPQGRIVYAVIRAGPWLADAEVDATQAHVLRLIVPWLRDEAVPRLKPLNSPLRTVVNEDSYECRGRNRVAGAKVSEHGKGNAIDVRDFILADRRKIVLTDVTEPKELREGLRDSACRRFTTVLGPGSDAYHEQHIHLDVLERRAGYRICQWAVREPTPPAMVASGEAVPLPPPRPPVPETQKL